jgi:hypothetical protein
MLGKGEKDVVLQYLDSVGKFWGHDDPFDPWAKSRRTAAGRRSQLCFSISSCFSPARVSA